MFLSFAEQAMDLETPTGSIHGTLTVPAAISRVPVLLFIAGSGPTDRDGNSPVAAGRNDSLKLLAAALAQRGIASVRYDKRGVAASRAAGPAESDLRFDTYVEDAAAWVAKLAKDARFQGVALLGHSEGSLIAMLAAQRAPARALISVAGPSEKAPALLRRQLHGRLPSGLAQRNDEILKALENGGTVSDVPAPLLALYRPSVQPYLISWFRYSPVEEVAGLRVPCLLVQGGTDIQVGVSDVRALHAANPRCVLEVIEGMNHVLKRVALDQQAQIASYGDPSLALDPDLATTIERFVSSQPVRAAFRTSPPPPSPHTPPPPPAARRAPG